LTVAIAGQPRTRQIIDATSSMRRYDRTVSAGLKKERHPAGAMYVRFDKRHQSILRYGKMSQPPDLRALYLEFFLLNVT
jgi:hypothetical protein